MRTIKESFRALYHQLPSNTIQKLMVRYGPKDVVKWTNIFPPKGLVSKTYSPREILTAKPLDYKNICQMRFLSYGQSIHETNPADMTTPRTLDVIYL